MHIFISFDKNILLCCLFSSLAGVDKYISMKIKDNIVWVNFSSIWQGVSNDGLSGNF